MEMKNNNKRQLQSQPQGQSKRSKTTATTTNSNSSYLPLITCENDKYHVNEAAKEFLESVTGPLAIVSIVGKYRQGKSWLANQVLLNCSSPNEGFSVGGTTRACTKGLLLATKILKIKQADGSKLNTLVIDTEGIGALNASSTHDARIFALAMLHSSFMLYNSMGPIDEAALENLSLITNLTKEIRFRSNDGKEAAAAEISTEIGMGEEVIKGDSELRSYFPSLLWVLRDFSLKMVDENNASITSDQYLEHALAHSETGGAHDQQKNRIRKTLRTFFPDRACVQLVRPSNHEGEVDMADKSKLRPEFLVGLKHLHSTIIRGIKPKLVGGKPISGPIFVKMCECFVAAINNNAMPVVRDVWDMLSKDRCSEALNEALALWETQEASILQVLDNGTHKWMSEPELAFKLKTMVKATQQLFDARVIAGEHNQTFALKLKELLDQKQLNLKKRNHENIKNHLRNDVLVRLRKEGLKNPSALRQLYDGEQQRFSVNNNNSSNNEFVLVTHDWLWEMVEALQEKIRDYDQEAEIKKRKEHEEQLRVWKTEYERLERDKENQIGDLQISLQKERQEKQEKSVQEEVARAQLVRFRQEQSDERIQEASQHQKRLQEVQDECQVRLSELQAECKNWMEQAENARSVVQEYEEEKSKMAELEAEKTLLQQECLKLEEEKNAAEDEFEQQLQKLRGESMEGMCELREHHTRAVQALEAEMQKQEKMIQKQKTEMEAQKEVRRQLEEAQQQENQLRAHLQETKKAAEMALERLRDKAQEELRLQREQSGKEMREWTEKEMSLTQKLQLADHRSEATEQRLADVTKKWTTEMQGRASEKQQLQELPRLKEKLMRLEMQNKSLKEQHLQTNQLLRQATDRVTFLERQMKEKERKQEIANTSAQLLLARQQFLTGGVVSANSKASE